MQCKHAWPWSALVCLLLLFLAAGTPVAMAQNDVGGNDGDTDLGENETPEPEDCGECVDVVGTNTHTTPGGTVITLTSSGVPNHAWARVCQKDGKTIIKLDPGAPVKIDVANGEKIEVKGMDGGPANNPIIINSNVGGSGEGNSITVNNNGTTTINGNRNNVSTTTAGGTVTVDGDRNTVNSTTNPTSGNPPSAGTLNVTGDRNNVNSTSTGSNVNVSGDRNVVNSTATNSNVGITGNHNTINSTAGGGTVTIGVNSSNNTVNNIAGGSGSTTYQAPQSQNPTNSYSTQPGESGQNVLVGSWVPR